MTGLIVLFALDCMLAGVAILLAVGGAIVLRRERRDARGRER